jgi:hypothetical protein
MKGEWAGDERDEKGRDEGEVEVERTRGAAM